MLRILTFSTLFPNATAPHFGVFVENRLRQLVDSGAVEARVVAPVPWVPRGLPLPAGYARLARVPAAETRHGLTVLHPRYPQLPRIGMSLHPFGLAAAVLPLLRRLIREGFDFDLLDAHYFYPDGVAAWLLARWLGKPYVVTARGSDLNRFPDFAVPRALIRRAAGAADGLITVSQALAGRLQALGVAAERVAVLRNGVDLELFAPRDRAEARARFGVPAAAPLLASVGNLVAGKGHHLVIDALRALPGVHLLIAGGGPQAAELQARIDAAGLAARARLLGPLAHEVLPELYAAADVLVLASASEGWPNVLLEAMACGTPVCATAVGGIPEVVAAPEAGRLLAEREPAALAAALAALLAAPPARDATRRYAEGFGWAPTTRGQLELFHAILARRRAAPAAA